MNHTTLAVVAIVAVAALLITATSLGATQAFAHKKSNRVSQRSGAEIDQQNKQSATCIQPALVNLIPISCNEIGLNVNAGPATSANVFTH